MPSSNEIFEKVRETLAVVLGLDENAITLDDSLVADFVVDVDEFPRHRQPVWNRTSTRRFPVRSCFLRIWPTVDTSWVEPRFCNGRRTG